MKKVLFFTGAGISAESGIPTFNEQDGLRDKLTRSFALAHKEEYRETIKQMCAVVNKAKPNDAHLAIAKYGFPVITMNIDGLHQRAGAKNVIPIHGRLPEPHELYADNFNELTRIRERLWRNGRRRQDCAGSHRQMEQEGGYRWCADGAWRVDNH